MPGPFDPNDAYWAELRRSPVFARAWNAALWEAAKLIDDCPPSSRDGLLSALRDLTLRDASV